MSRRIVLFLVSLALCLAAFALVAFVECRISG